MFLLCFLLVPMTLAGSRKLTIDNYVVNVIDRTLSSVHSIGESSDNLNLSALGIRYIDKDVFRNLSHLKNLNLGSNSLSALPKFAFTNFTSLEHLSLANNEFRNFKNAFVGLDNLKTLNISNNPIHYLRRGSLFGLSKSADVFTDGVPLFSMETGLYESPLLQTINYRDEMDYFIERESIERRSGRKTVIISADTKYLFSRYGTAPDLDTSLRVQLCSNKRIVTKLEVLTNGSELEYGCREVKVDYELNTVHLRQLGITGFHNSWYRLQDYAIVTLDLQDNNIVDVTNEILNDLPKGLERVIFTNNKINRLFKSRISNQHLRHLILMNNSISEIEDSALENMKIQFLDLQGNKLNNTRFIATLPDSIKEMDLSQNCIQELPDGSFSSRGSLLNLKLDDNNIAEIKRESLRGLSSLRALTVRHNNLRKIESGSFKDLRALIWLVLERNNLTSLDKGIFTGLESVDKIDIRDNQLTKLTRDSFYKLPDTLRDLYLDFNQIDSLDHGTFVNVPNHILSLGNNKISKITKGSFDLPNLDGLFLNENSLSEVDGESFEGLGQLEYLSLDANGIAKIEKGFAKNLDELYGLSLSNNPITRLEKGALFGFRKEGRAFIDLKHVQVEVIQGGLFDDV